MIYHLEGKLVEINPAFAIVDCGGVGYLVNISLHTYGEIVSLKQVKLYTYAIYKEDAQSLYGFHTKSEKDVFALLISVSGVGGNTARVILSSLSAQEVQDCIVMENVKMLQSVKGIGGKTAQRIIVDLKDKISRLEMGGAALTAGSTSVISEAASALEVLGYPTRQTDKLLKELLKAKPEMELEELLKTALKRL